MLPADQWRRFAQQVLDVYFRPTWTLKERIQGFGSHLAAGVSEDDAPDHIDDEFNGERPAKRRRPPDRN